MHFITDMVCVSVIIRFHHLMRLCDFPCRSVCISSVLPASQLSRLPTSCLCYLSVFICFHGFCSVYRSSWHSVCRSFRLSYVSSLPRILSVILPVIVPFYRSVDLSVLLLFILSFILSFFLLY